MNKILIFIEAQLYYEKTIYISYKDLHMNKRESSKFRSILPSVDE